MCYLRFLLDDHEIIFPCITVFAVSQNNVSELFRESLMSMKDAHSLFKNLCACYGADRGMITYYN